MQANVKQPAPVLVYGHPSLRRVAKLIPASYSLPALKAHAETMWETLSATGNGTALAAPQIGLDLRLFIMKADVSGFPAGMFTSKFYTNRAYRIFINPYLASTTGKILINSDGCLSIPGYGHGGVTRYEEFTLRFQELADVSNPGENEKLGLTEQEIAGFRIISGQDFGWIVQHEIEHLDGKFFVDQFPDAQGLNAYEAGTYTAGYATLPKTKF